MQIDEHACEVGPNSVGEGRWGEVQGQRLHAASVLSVTRSGDTAVRTLLIRSAIFGGAPIALVRMSTGPPGRPFPSAVFSGFDAGHVAVRARRSRSKSIRRSNSTAQRIVIHRHAFETRRLFAPTGQHRWIPHSRKLSRIRRTTLVQSGKFRANSRYSNRSTGSFPQPFHTNCGKSSR